MGGCSEEIGGLCCIAFKPVKNDGAVILDTTYQQDVKKCGSLTIQWELLFCNRYIVYRNKMLSSLAILNMNGVEIDVDTLLFGNDFLSDETNCEIFLIIQIY